MFQVANIGKIKADNWLILQVACIGEIKAVFWARGVENIYIEQPIEQYKVLESSEGYWIGNFIF